MWFHQYFYVLLANTGPSYFDTIFKVRLCTEIKCQPTDLGVPRIYILQVYWPRCVALVFVPPAPATAHVQVFEKQNKTRQTHKEGVRLSHLVIHRKQACCTSNHTSAAAPSSASTAETSANRRQDSSTTWARCWHTHPPPPTPHTHTHKAYPSRYYGHREQSHKSFLFIYNVITNRWGLTHLDAWTSEASGLLVFIIIGSSLWTNQKMDNVGRRSCGRSCWSSRLKKPRREVGLL